MKTNRRATVLTAAIFICYLLPVCSGVLRAADGYEAMGYLTYTPFDESGQPKGKRVIMFDVKMADTWCVHTEPVVECKNGIAYLEGFSDSNKCVWLVGAFEAAYKPSESPFQKLRAELKQSKKEDVYFKNPTYPLPPWIASRATNLASERVESNVAIATAMPGEFPPTDSSYAAFLSFAFSPPRPQRDGTNQMLLEIWDEGNPHSVRFHHATWKTFPELPGLVASARYTWPGKQFLPDGRVIPLSVRDVPRLESTAATYEVNATTNLGALVLPAKITLTRFSAGAHGRPSKLLTTDVAVVVSVRRLEPGERVQPELPGRTYVSDCRFPGSGGDGSTAYFLNGGPLPALKEVKAAAPDLHHQRLELR